MSSPRFTYRAITITFVVCSTNHIRSLYWLATSKSSARTPPRLEASRFPESRRRRTGNRAGRVLALADRTQKLFYVHFLYSSSCLEDCGMECDFWLRIVAFQRIEILRMSRSSALPNSLDCNNRILCNFPIEQVSDSIHAPMGIYSVKHWYRQWDCKFGVGLPSCCTILVLPCTTPRTADSHRETNSLTDHQWFAMPDTYLETNVSNRIVTKNEIGSNKQKWDYT